MTFEVGDEVLVGTPDFNSRIHGKPGIITSVWDNRPEKTYKVRIPDVPHDIRSAVLDRDEYLIRGEELSPLRSAPTTHSTW